MTWMLKYWKVIAIGLAVLLIAYGAWSRMDKTLINLLVKQYQQEAQQTIDNRDDEIAKLEKEKDTINKRLTQIEKEKQAYVAKYTETQKKLRDLEDAISHIVTPSDLDDIIADLKKRGYSSATRAPSPNK